MIELCDGKFEIHNLKFHTKLIFFFKSIQEFHQEIETIFVCCAGLNFNENIVQILSKLI